ncbi:MAG: DUF5106 domain-containing protein [Chitinophagales bacterium]
MKRFLPILLLCSVLQVQAQSKTWNIRIHIDGISDTTLMLAHHYGDVQYVIDTVPINAHGDAVFTGLDSLKGGIYLIVMPSMNNKYFECVISGREPDISLSTDTSDFIGHMRIKGSKENEVFFADLNFLAAKRTEITALKTQLDAVGDTTETGKKIREEMEAVNKQVEEERLGIIRDNPGLFYSVFLRAIQDVKAPEAPEGMSEEEARNYKYWYVRTHYFDNVNFMDERLLRTNMYDQRIKKYMRDYVPKIPDSVNVAVDEIIHRAEGNKLVFQYMVVSMLNEYAKSKIMGYDAVYIHIVDTYYANGKAFWLDDMGLFKILQQADKIRPNLIGKQAPLMILQDSANNDIPLYSLQNTFTVIVFWDVDCSHCKKDIPKLENIYPQLKAMGAEVYAVYSQEEWDKWIQWQREHHDSWIIVGNKSGKSDFQWKYNVDQTPLFYILDKDKKIIAKRLGVENILEFLENYEKLQNAE